MKNKILIAPNRTLDYNNQKKEHPDPKRPPGKNFGPQKKVKMIPPILHHTWKTRDNIPEEWQPSVDQARIFCEKFGFEYRMWSDDDLLTLVKTHFPQHLELYLSYTENIQRVDIARCMVLSVHGGIYMDLDLSLKEDPQYQESFYYLYRSYRDIASVVIGQCKNDEDFVLGQASHTNSFMMSEVGANFWTKTVFVKMYNPYKGSLYKKILSATRHFRVINGTGPGLITGSVKKHEKSTPDEKPILTCPAQFTAPDKNWFHKPYENDDSFVVVLPGSSWEKGSHGAKAKMWHYRDLFVFPSLFIAIILFITFLVLYIIVR